MERIQYRRRVPKSLIDVLNRTEITKLCTRSEALNTDADLEKANSIMLLDLDYDSKYELIYPMIKDHISKKMKRRSFLKELTYLDAVGLYLKSCEGRISDNEVECKRYFFIDLFHPILTHIIKENPPIEEIEAIHLNQAKSIITKLPSRNIGKYRQIEISDLIELVSCNRIKVEQEHKLSLTTINKHLKRLVSLSNYGKNSGLFELVNCNLLIPNKRTKLRDRRDALSLKEIDKLINWEKMDDVSLLILISFYSGLRLSEISKCKVVEGNTPYFDLRSKKLTLKTSSSYRRVPIHKDLLPYIERIKELEYNKLLWLARCCKDRINSRLKDTENKSLYSLRHSFATELISNSINPAIVSELMGHSQKSLTLSVYTKQFPLGSLNNALQTLAIK